MASQSINNASITTSEEILNGSYCFVAIKNTSLVTVTISAKTPAVANEGYPLAAWASMIMDFKTNGLTNVVLYAVANSGTGSLSILAI